MPYDPIVNIGVEGKWKSKATNVEFKVVGGNGCRYVASVPPMLLGPIDKAASKPAKGTIVAPYWLVRRVQDKNMANMRKSTMVWAMTTVGEDKTASQQVTLPIMHNIKEVKDGEELLVYIEPVIPARIEPAQILPKACQKKPAAVTGTLIMRKKHRKK